MDMDWLNRFAIHTRQIIGEAIYASVGSMVWNDALSKKIVGMLIDLPLVEIYQYLGDFNILSDRIQEAW